LVRNIASGSQAAALTAGQANDALAALQRLNDLYRDTGRRVSLLAAASEYAEAARKPSGHQLDGRVVHDVDQPLEPERKPRASAATESRGDALRLFEHLPEQRLGQPAFESGVLFAQSVNLLLLLQALGTVVEAVEGRGVDLSVEPRRAAGARRPTKPAPGRPAGPPSGDRSPGPAGAAAPVRSGHRDDGGDPAR